MLQIIQIIFTIYLVILCLCVMLRSAGADYHNPVVQVIVKLTDFLLKPLRAIVPTIMNFDTGGFVGVVLVKFIELIIIFLVKGFTISILGLIIVAIILILKLMINIWIYAMILQAFLSWFKSRNPALGDALVSLNRPILGIFRQILPVFSGLDLSPLLAMVVLQLVSTFVLSALLRMALGLL